MASKTSERPLFEGRWKKEKRKGLCFCHTLSKETNCIKRVLDIACTATFTLSNQIQREAQPRKPMAICLFANCFLFFTLLSFSFTHSFFFIYPLFIEFHSMDHDLERCPILARSTRPQRRRHIARRHALFALLVMACIICVYMSYHVSSNGQLPCSNYFVWIPNCNKEQYYVLPS